MKLEKKHIVKKFALICKAIIDACVVLISIGQALQLQLKPAYSKKGPVPSCGTIDRLNIIIIRTAGGQMQNRKKMAYGSWGKKVWEPLEKSIMRPSSAMRFMYNITTVSKEEQIFLLDKCAFRCLATTFGVEPIN